MFTGLIEKTGILDGFSAHDAGMRLAVRHEPWDTPVTIGESISVQGVCLSVTRALPGRFECNLLGETMKLTSLCSRKRGMIVNLERALRISDRLGGHIVTGHIDGTGKVVSFKKESRDWILEIECGRAILDGICLKGSVACDGVSLTIAEVLPGGFRIHLIPLTVETTAFAAVSPGDAVNIETDVIGKYVQLRSSAHESRRTDENGPKPHDDSSGGITIDALKKAGFAV